MREVITRHKNRKRTSNMKRRINTKKPKKINQMMKLSEINSRNIKKKYIKAGIRDDIVAI